MNIRNYDYLGLLNEIAIASDRQFSEVQTMSLVDELKKIDWKDAYRIIVRFVRQPSLPKNIYGSLISAIEYIKYENKKKLEKSEPSWKPATDDMATPEEFILTMKIIGKLSSCENARKNLEDFATEMNDAIDRKNLTGYLMEIDKGITV